MSILPTGLAIYATVVTAVAFREWLDILDLQGDLIRANVKLTQCAYEGRACDKPEKEISK